MSKKPDRWQLNEERFVSRELDGEHILVDLRSGEYFTIDGAGGYLYELLISGKEPAEIESKILDRYKDAAPARVRKDLLELTRQLRADKMIRQRSGE